MASTDSGAWMGSTNPKWLRSDIQQCPCAVPLSVPLASFSQSLIVDCCPPSWGFSATYLDVLLGSVCSPSLQQCHRAASKASPGHPAAINAIDFQGCCHQLVQLRAAHFIVIPGERRAVLCPVLHPGHNHCTPDSPSLGSHCRGSSAGCCRPWPSCHILGHPHLSELWLSTISFPKVL